MPTATQTGGMHNTMQPDTRGASPADRTNTLGTDEKERPGLDDDTSYIESAKQYLAAYGNVNDALHAHPAVRKPDTSQGLRATLGQAGDLIGVTVAIIAVGVIVFVGINIMSATREQTALNESDAFYAPMTDFTDTMGSMFGYIGLAMLAAMAAVIIGYLVAFRGSSVSR